MTYTDAKSSFEKLFQGDMSEGEGKDLLISLYEKGESIEEIQAATEVMRSHLIPLEVSDSIKDKLFDNCGTGGDKSGTFNVSTTVSFILAAAGLYIAKHGNRSITSKSGSADMLEALGMNLDLPPKKLSTLLEETGFAFLFAQKHHPAMKFVMPIRKSIPHRTVFNILGPLTNPAGAKKQLVGVFDSSFNRKMAEVLKNTGSTDAVVLSAKSGLDEIALHEETLASKIEGDKIVDFEIRPWELGMEKTPLEMLQGGDAKENAAITVNILNGVFKKGKGKRDIVLMNSAMALVTAGLARDLKDGIDIANEMIDSGKAFQVMQQAVEISQKL